MMTKKSAKIGFNYFKNLNSIRPANNSWKIVLKSCHPQMIVKNEAGSKCGEKSKRINLDLKSDIEHLIIIHNNIMGVTSTSK